MGGFVMPPSPLCPRWISAPLPWAESHPSLWSPFGSHSWDLCANMYLSIVWCHYSPSTSASLSLSSTSNPSRDLLFPNTDLINIFSLLVPHAFSLVQASPSLLLSDYSCICPVNRFLCESRVPSSLFMQCSSNKNLFVSLPSLQRTQSKSLPQRSEHWHLFPGTPSSLCLRCDCRSLPSAPSPGFRASHTVRLSKVPFPPLSSLWTS